MLSLVSAFLAEKTRTPPRIFLWWCFYIGGSFPKAPSQREPLYVISLRIVGSGFCPMVRGHPRAMLAIDASVGKAEKDTIQGLLGFETTN